MDNKQLLERAHKLFSERGTFMSLCQEIAENFYPERADFTLRREIGNEFAGNLMTSYPVQVRRDLGDQIGQMLRPTEKEWFHVGTEDQERLDHESKRWLKWAANTQRRAMYDIRTHFARATTEADDDFACFGQAVIRASLNRNLDGLLYRTKHLRDVVWSEDEDGEICFVACKWRPHGFELERYAGFNLTERLRAKINKNPLDRVECMHIVTASELYSGDTKGKPWASVYLTIEPFGVLEETPVRVLEYIIPRWQTVSGSQYAYSPATIVGLADARTIQAMTYTLLEAGEKATNPPMVATQDAVRSDIAIYPGGTTWVDYDYDERLGSALRPLTIDTKGIPHGIDMQRDARALLMQAFYLNKLTLPQRTPQMTAYEVGQRIQEWIRAALPIFEPMEHDYNGKACETTFDLLLHGGAFGSPFDIPKRLQGRDFQFRFRSPLHDAVEQIKGQVWMQSKALIADAMSIDQSAIALLDAKVAVRDALEGIGCPPAWLRSEPTVKQIEEAQAAAERAQQLMGAMQAGSEVAANMGAARKDEAAAVA